MMPFSPLFLYYYASARCYCLLPDCAAAADYFLRDASCRHYAAADDCRRLRFHFDDIAASDAISLPSPYSPFHLFSPFFERYFLHFSAFTPRRYDALYFRRHRFAMPPLLDFFTLMITLSRYFRLMPLFASARRCAARRRGAAIVDG
jgi:hypothetical protein